MKIQDYAYRNPDADRIEYGVTRVIEALTATPAPAPAPSAAAWDVARLRDERVSLLREWCEEGLLATRECNRLARAWFEAPLVLLDDERLGVLYVALAALADHRWLERGRADADAALSAAGELAAARHADVAAAAE